MKTRIALLVCVLSIASCAVAQGPAVKKDPKELAALSKLEKQRNAAKSQYFKHENATTRQSFVTLNDHLANDTMMAQSLSPREKYTKALRLYRYSLKVDPHDAEASKWVSEIERIYKSMGRPIPK